MEQAQEAEAVQQQGKVQAQGRITEPSSIQAVA